MKHLIKLLALLALTMPLGAADPAIDTIVGDNRYTDVTTEGAVWDGNVLNIGSDTGAYVVYVNNLLIRGDLAPDNAVINFVHANPDGILFGTGSPGAGLIFDERSDRPLTINAVGPGRGIQYWGWGFTIYQNSTDAVLTINSDFDGCGAGAATLTKWGAGTLVWNGNGTRSNIHVQEGTLIWTGETSYIIYEGDGLPYYGGLIRVEAGATLIASGVSRTASVNPSTGLNVSGTLYARGLTTEIGASYIKDGATLRVDFSLGSPALIANTMTYFMDDVTLDIQNIATGSMTVLDGLYSLGYTGANNGFANVTLGGSMGTEVDLSGKYDLVSLDGLWGLNVIYGANSIVVNAEFIPEPTTWALMVGGLGALALLRRRRS